MADIEQLERRIVLADLAYICGGRRDEWTEEIRRNDRAAKAIGVSLVFGGSSWGGHHDAVSGYTDAEWQDVVTRHRLVVLAA